MASGTTRRNSAPSRLVFSDVHSGSPCKECFLCKEKQPVYTHAMKWKDQSLLTYLRDIEPEMSIDARTCICRNCRLDLANGQRDSANYHPRWAPKTQCDDTCEVPNCEDPACRSTKLGTKELLRDLFNCQPKNEVETKLCSKHYLELYKKLHPDKYQFNCAVCSAPVKSSSSFRPCAAPEIYQSHLQEYTGFTGVLTGTDKLCLACYRHNLMVVKKEKAITNDKDLASLVTDIENSFPDMPFSISDEGRLLEIGLSLTVISVARDLQENRPMTLLCAHSRFLDNMDTLLPLCAFEYESTPHRTPRWLLGQLSAQLKHHMSYTCIVRKHGVLIYRQGRELHALSYAMFAARKGKQKPDVQEVLKGLNKKIHKLIKTTMSKNLSSLDMDQLIQDIDPEVWDAIRILTQTASDKNNPDNSLVKKTRCLFILHQIMFCIDNQCSTPFHIVIADLIECCGGSAELVKFLNRLGVCVSYDTLLRHIQSTVEKEERKGLLLGLSPDGIIIFTMDNVDFQKGYAQIFNGNQILSWHGTTLQAVKTKPSLDTAPLDPMATRRRSHALLSPFNSPDCQEQLSAPKRLRGRARTGTEFQSEVSSSSIPSSYDFQSQSIPSDEPTKSMAISDFRQTTSEEAAVKHLLTQAFSYCLIKNALPADKKKEFVGFQEFVGIITNVPTPEVGQVKYLSVLDEIADSKDTVLHIISDLYTRHMVAHNHKFVVLEGDAKVWDIIQGIKHEYGPDLDWLIPMPGDWHLLKNYQICLMKPFFEAGLKDLAIASGYPANSILSCSKFKRTHYFLMEIWEGLFRHMLQLYLAHHNKEREMNPEYTLDLEGLADHYVEELEINQNDKLAAYSVISSLQNQLSELGMEEGFYSYVEQMSKKDDTWRFWARFVLQDCLPYVGLFMAMRSESWELRIASIKSMAPNFTAFDHPTYQKLISQHIVDVFNMPPTLLDHFKKGGFVLSISGRVLHSVGLDECHEMLINRHVKNAVVRPSAEYIRRIARYIHTRSKCIEQFLYQIFGTPEANTTVKSVIFSGHPTDRKSEGNIWSQLEKIADLLPDNLSKNRGLINPFRKLTANKTQTHDLLMFHEIGIAMFENRVEAYVLKTPSVKVPMKRKRLQTFSASQKGKNKKVASMEREVKQMQKCMRKKIAYACKTGTSADVMGEQFIEFPRALCNIDNLPVKGQKSLVSGFYQGRYSNIIMQSFPANWTPDSVILEGMFLIHTKPLPSHKIMADYGKFLMNRFITPYFKKGCKEVHLLFDDPGQQQENPKIFEQSRRDMEMAPDHLCTIFFNDAAVPTKWQHTLKCRICKRGLTVYLSSYIVNQIGPSLHDTQKFVTAGATDGPGGEEATSVGVCSTPVFESNVSESDTRVWLHAKHSAGTHKLVLSPDTDVYHVGLPLISPTDKVIVQLSKPSDKGLKLLDLSLLADVLKRDPHLAHVAAGDVSQIIQTLFVSTGCDYVSFFSGIGKNFFYKVFFSNAMFIMADNPGALSTAFESETLCEQARSSLLPFIRLVGCAYMKKHANAFYGQTPESLFNSFSGASSPTEQHTKWLDHLRQGIWDRIAQENESIPSFTALHLHWLRSCWVLHMWQQAESNKMVLAPLSSNGWTRDDNGMLSIQWDTEESRRMVKERVMLLMKGCGCKWGCKSGRCGCRKRKIACGPGCRCINCTNTGTPETRATPPTEANDTLDVEVNGVMEVVFGDSDGREHTHVSDGAQSASSADICCDGVSTVYDSTQRDCSDSDSDTDYSEDIAESCNHEDCEYLENLEQFVSS